MSRARKLDRVFVWADTEIAEVIDHKLMRMRPERMDPHVAFGVVTSTFPRRSLLHARPIFAGRLRLHMRARGTLTKDVERVLLDAIQEGRSMVTEMRG